MIQIALEIIGWMVYIKGIPNMPSIETDEYLNKVHHSRKKRRTKYAWINPLKISILNIKYLYELCVLPLFEETIFIDPVVVVEEKEENNQTNSCCLPSSAYHMCSEM